jgi:hypothetical protein
MKTKLSVAMLDNSVNSAVVNIGKTGAYVEVFINGTDLCICLINDEGDIVRSFSEVLVNLKNKTGGWTAPKFEGETV